MRLFYTPGMGIPITTAILHIVERWLTEVDDSAFYRTKFGLMLKTNLIERGRWKSLPRGKVNMNIRIATVKRQDNNPIVAPDVDRRTTIAKLQEAISIPAHKEEPAVVVKDVWDMNEEEFSEYLSLVKRGKKKPPAESIFPKLPVWQQEILMGR